MNNLNNVLKYFCVYIIRGMYIISEMQIDHLSLELYRIFELGWFEAELITWYGARIRTVTFSESRQ